VTAGGTGATTGRGPPGVAGPTGAAFCGAVGGRRAMTADPVANELTVAPAAETDASTNE
jgi:hypothetical protein